MRTRRQELGDFGERQVVKSCSCPKCKRERTLRKLPANFKCADVICDFCGYLAQVKAATVTDVTKMPDKIVGAAWGPQKARMNAGIYFPLFLVLVSETESAVYYLSADMQSPKMFLKRKPLSVTARRAGWQGFYYDMKQLKNRAIVRLF